MHRTGLRVVVAVLLAERGKSTYGSPNEGQRMAGKCSVGGDYQRRCYFAHGATPLYDLQEVGRVLGDHRSAVRYRNLADFSIALLGEVGHLGYRNRVMACTPEAARRSPAGTSHRSEASPQ